MIEKKHYALALASQSACNMSGIVFAFAAALRAMCEEGLDTEARNRHPISRLYAEQIAHLSGILSASSADYRAATIACEEGAK